MDNLQTMARGDNLSTKRGLSPTAKDFGGQGEALAMDLNQLLIRQPGSTYLFRISGHTYADQGIFDGDVAIIDRALQAGARDLIVAGQGSGVLLCRQHQLLPEDTPWGVVTAIIHQYRR